MAGRVTRCQCRKCADGPCGIMTTNLNEFTSAAICDPCQEGNHRAADFELKLPGPASTRDMDAFGPFEDYEGREATA